MSIQRALQGLKRFEKRGEVTAWVKIEAQPGSFADLPDDVPPALVQALAHKNIHRLYSHQEESYRLTGQGKHIVVITPTASGKTLSYNLPVLSEMMRNPDARALYLFPTKALAQDQMSELQELIGLTGGSIGVNTYDGDTPADMRRKIRERASVILTNPDMLHTAILPHHTKWAPLFENLRYVVVDELHHYRGVFGSHVANVLRRLKRVARFYNSRIQFICASATIANPQDLAGQLLEEEVECIQRNGAPRSEKHLIFLNPPIVNPDLGLRRSAIATARSIAERFLREEVQTLVFATSRVNVEVLLSYLQKAMQKAPGHPERVRGYRGGYLPRTRREIERQLREGEILGVVSTNALELGIDIGSLQACVLAGYPGSIASTWQQIGRAGRRNGGSAAVLIARNLPLDQFIVNHPEYYLESSPEHALINPDNLQILVSHIQCAAFELPFHKGERFGKENLEEILDFLSEQGMLTRTPGAWHWSSEAYPADSVSLRNIPEENFVVFNVEDQNRAIAEVDFDSAPELIHTDAIYICEGRQYHVESLDYPGRKAYVRPVKVDYYTEAITYSALRVLRCDEERKDRYSTRVHGEVHLVKKFPGFKKVRFYTSENLGYGEIGLPLHELHTTAYWMSMTEEQLAPLGLSRNEIILAFLGMSYAMRHLATLTLMCDIGDLGRSVGDRSSRWFAQSGKEGLGFFSGNAEDSQVNPYEMASFEPAFFLYDNRPGGVGFAEKMFRTQDALVERTLKLVTACPCKHGCPSCVGPVDELGKGTKHSAALILKLLSSLGMPAELETVQ